MITNISDLVKEPFHMATKEDLPFLLELEKECFEDYRQSSKESILRSITSDNQFVLIIKDNNNAPYGSVTLRKYKKKLRIFNLAIVGKNRGNDYGRLLMEKTINIAKDLNMSTLSLEVDSNGKSLIKWYESFGFQQTKVLEHYYKEKKHAIKMEMQLINNNRYLVVTDFDTDFFKDMENVKHIRSAEYFDDIKYHKAKDLRVINLCSNYKYQSVGYYVSLMALARNQVSYPSAGLLRDIDNQRVLKSVGEEVNKRIESSLSKSSKNEILINSYFGVSDLPEFQKLVHEMNNLYSAPFISYQFMKKDCWYLKKIKILPFKDILKKDILNLKDYSKKYFENKLFIRSPLKHYEYDMAILIDKDEKLPPSDVKALKEFEKAAEQTGFYVEYITKKDYSRIPEFDALFIRTTTNVNDYTYDFSRFAYAEGLVVMDDPWSILRCANKIYLHEALLSAKINTPKTWILNKKRDYKSMVKNLIFPTVLKLPDSAFSLGVYKVYDEKGCLAKLNEMFKESDLIIAQEYMPTDYDWRIGVLDGEFLYACKYYMAKGHWQIVSWDGKNSEYQEGAYESIPLDMVPKDVLKCAIKASDTIGDGLYGVDLKYKDGKIYVIEVNDNPSIEYGVEDGIDGNQLYLKIMRSFYNRLENNRCFLRTIT